MKNPVRIIAFLLLLLLFATTIARADLPDLPKQELWVKIISLVVGLVVIFSLSIMGLNRIMYDMMGMDAEMSTKLSIIIGVILSFLWFLYIFGQIFETTIKIALGALIFVCIIVYFLREKSDSNGDEDDMD